jgi:hypothetical protein
VDRYESLNVNSHFWGVTKMFIFSGKDAINMTDVYADSISTGEPDDLRARWMSISVMFLLLSGLASGTTTAATRVDLSSAILQLQETANLETKQGTEVLNALHVVTAPPSSLTVGLVQVSRGGQINLPIYLKENSSRSISGVQFDVVIASGMSPMFVNPGIAAQAANKTVTGNAVPSGYRVLIFGINQTAIQSGPVALIRVAVDGNAGLGKRDIIISNIVASDPTGSAIPTSGKNGAITIK